MSENHRSCTHCGKRLTASGRRSASGIYYCRAPECQRVKARRNYQAANGGVEPAQAPTICANPRCGAPLKPRPVRVGDSTLGRWCDRAACRRHKAAVLELGNGATQGDVQVLRESLELVAVAYNIPRVTCPVCGVDDAVPGYRHPSPDVTRCEGTGDKIARSEAVQIIWGSRIGQPHPAMLALAQQQIEAASRPQEVHPS